MTIKSGKTQLFVREGATWEWLHLAVVDYIDRIGWFPGEIELVVVGLSVSLHDKWPPLGRNTFERGSVLSVIQKGGKTLSEWDPEREIFRLTVIELESQPIEMEIHRIVTIPPEDDIVRVEWIFPALLETNGNLGGLP